MIVSDTYIGNTRILINDECVITDPGRIREILRRVGQAAANRSFNEDQDQRERCTTGSPVAAAAED